MVICDFAPVFALCMVDTIRFAEPVVVLEPPIIRLADPDRVREVPMAVPCAALVVLFIAGPVCATAQGSVIAPRAKVSSAVRILRPHTFMVGRLGAGRA